MFFWKEALRLLLLLSLQAPGRKINKSAKASPDSCWKANSPGGSLWREAWKLHCVSSHNSKITLFHVLGKERPNLSHNGANCEVLFFSSVQSPIYRLVPRSSFNWRSLTLMMDRWPGVEKITAAAENLSRAQCGFIAPFPWHRFHKACHRQTLLINCRWQPRKVSARLAKCGASSSYDSACHTVRPGDVWHKTPKLTRQSGSNTPFISAPSR